MADDKQYVMTEVKREFNRTKCKFCKLSPEAVELLQRYFDNIQNGDKLLRKLKNSDKTIDLKKVEKNIEDNRRSTYELLKHLPNQTEVSVRKLEDLKGIPEFQKAMNMKGFKFPVLSRRDFQKIIEKALRVLVIPNAKAKTPIGRERQGR